MKTYTLILILLTSFIYELKADYSYNSYLVKGKIVSSTGKKVKNTELLIQQEDLFKLVKTNNKGQFTVELTYFVPCPSEKRKHTGNTSSKKAESTVNIWISSLEEGVTIKTNRKDITFSRIKTNKEKSIALANIRKIETSLFSQKKIIKNSRNEKDTYKKEYCWAIEGLLGLVELRGLTIQEVKLKTNLSPEKYAKNKMVIRNKLRDYNDKLYILTFNAFGVISDVETVWEKRVD